MFANAVQLLDYAIQFLRNYPDKYPLPALPSFIVVSHAFFILAMIAHLMVFGASLMAEQTDLSILKPVSKTAIGATIGVIIVCACDHSSQYRIVEYGIFLVLQAVVTSGHEQFFTEERKKAEEKKKVEAEKVERDGN